MTKYDKPLQSGTREYEEARKPDRPKQAVKREVRKAGAGKSKGGANSGRRS